MSFDPIMSFDTIIRNQLIKLQKADSSLNPLTAAIWGSGYKLFVKCAIIRGPARTLPAKWRRYPVARLERYMQNGTVIWMAGFTHRPSV